MINKNFYIRLVMRVVLITLSTLGFSYMVLTGNYLPASIFMILVIAQAVLLVKYFNQTNRKLTTLFEAIKNNDFSQNYSEDSSLKSVSELNKGLNILNQAIQDVKIRTRSRELYYLEILEQVDMGIITFDKSGHVLFSNPRARTLFNYDQLTNIRQLQRINDKLYDVLSELKPFESKLFGFSNEREQIQLIIKSGTLMLEGESMMLVVVQDIKNELDGKETDSWEKMMRVLIHEIMNIIAPITSVSETMFKYFHGLKQEEVDLASPQWKSAIKGLKVMKEQSNSLVNFVQSYRSLLNVPHPDKKIVPVVDLFSRVKLLASESVEEEGISLEVSEKPEFSDLFVDEEQVSQVMFNLVINAIQSLSRTPGGKVELSAEMFANGKKVIKIKDNGPGISAEEIDRIWVPFYTTKEEGTGIGLSLSKQIMKLHDGNLKVHSDPGRETVFTLIF